ncbi:FAD/NAD(P)-binding oxidoreductase [Brooklawnia cerclae]|uniref:NADPH-dependent 2,4-dienoyl-CoA reductase/sulfur reductase-like enzyme n=1 Tax=Brooklawnia cerclae TaxID=349934 RepID=A0ABX0SG52_9ACTN|nr:FAD-dependent oxidoreductase [Brooklawnia cerclae]NIH56190.1 NADPH-dependent 2,4-dienoyl-CoA reductase/sulfur reductase-like enzyme [Brooklawnia cerclae]
MRVVIIGGSHAGISCALRVREEYPDAEVVMYESQGSIGFIAQSIPLYLRGDKHFEKLKSYTDVPALERHGVVVRINTEIRGVDTDAKTLEVVPAGGVQFTDRYDKLVLATGSYPSIPLAFGSYRDSLYLVKNYEHATRIKELMESAKRIVIIGGGAIGVEVARALLHKNVPTTLLQSHATILDRYVDDEVNIDIIDSLRSAGLDVHTEALVTEFEEVLGPDGRRQVMAKTSDGRAFSGDGIIYATGFRPNSFLLGGKAELGDKGAIVVDDYMRTSIPDVFAVGDCSTTNLTNVARPVYVPHASDAFRQGEIAAINLVGPRQKINPSQGTYNLNIGSRTMCISGITYKRAIEEGLTQRLPPTATSSSTSTTSCHAQTATRTPTTRFGSSTRRGLTRFSGSNSAVRRPTCHRTPISCHWRSSAV